MSNNFEIVEKDVEDIKILSISGELDALVTPKLKDKIDKLLDNDCIKIVIDFKNVTHVNSLAMGVLRGELKNTDSLGGYIKLVALNENVKSIFEMVGLDEIFEIYETIEEAIR